MYSKEIQLYIYIYFRLFSIIGYYKILNTVPCTVCYGEGNGNLLQRSCLENSMDREDWRATIHGVTKSQT